MEQLNRAEQLLADNEMTSRRTQITVDLTARDTEGLDRIVAYSAEGKFGIEISREDAVRVAVRELADELAPRDTDTDSGDSA